MGRCGVISCHSSGSEIKSSSVTLHRLPRNKEKREKWINNLGAENLKLYTKEIFICSLHFEPSCFNRTLDVVRLRDDAVPLLCLSESMNSASNSSSDLKVCRICLSTDSKLYSIQKYNLMNAYEQLTGLVVTVEDTLPQRLCVECAHRLLASNNFKEKSLKSHKLLTDLALRGPLIIETVKKINRTNNGLTSPLNTKHYPPDYCDLLIEEKEDNNIEPTVNKEIEEIKTDDISEEETEVIPEIKDESIEIYAEDLDNLKDNDFSDFNIEYKSSTDDDIPLEVTRKKRKKKLKKERPVINENEPKVDRRKKPILIEELNVDLFTSIELTFEEQKAEIEKRQHTANYKNSPYKCTDCFKGFNDENAFNGHVIKHSNDSGEHECNVCKNHFKTKNAVRKHITAHHKNKYSCNQCPYETHHRQNAKLHQRWHTGTTYLCPHCPERFIRFTTYMGHVRIKHPSDFVCELCGYSYVSEKGIKLHKNLKHRLDDREVPEDGPLCELCNVRFVDDEAYKRHLQVSLKHNDTKKLPNVSSRRNEQQYLGRKPNWTQCSKNLDGPISCEQCGEQLSGSREYHSHFRRAHPDKNRTKYPAMRTPCMCEQCGRIFQSMALLNDHRWVHTDEKRFKCESCGKSFRMKQRLVAHMHVHSQVKRLWACSVCGKNFSNQGNRRRHMAIHSGLKPYKCEMCGKSFKSKNEKQSHITYVHLKKPWPKRSRGRRRPEQRSEADDDQANVPVWPCQPKMGDIAMMEDKPMYYNLKI